MVNNGLAAMPIDSNPEIPLPAHAPIEVWEIAAILRSEGIEVCKTPWCDPKSEATRTSIALAQTTELLMIGAASAYLR